MSSKSAPYARWVVSSSAACNAATVLRSRAEIAEPDSVRDTVLLGDMYTRQQVTGYVTNLGERTSCAFKTKLLHRVKRLSHHTCTACLHWSAYCTARLGHRVSRLPQWDACWPTVLCAGMHRSVVTCNTDLLAISAEHVVKLYTGGMLHCNLLLATSASRHPTAVNACPQLMMFRVGRRSTGGRLH